MRSVIATVVAALVLFLTMTGAAAAATPQDIYDDYAADNRLDGTYTDADLQAYLDDATVHQYGDQAVLSALDVRVSAVLAENRDSDEGRSAFPFTGSQALLMVVAAGFLLAGGLALRRRTT